MDEKAEHKIVIASPYKEREDILPRFMPTTDVGFATVASEVKNITDGLGKNIQTELREGRAGQRTLKPSEKGLDDTLFLIQAYTANYPYARSLAQKVIERGGKAAIGGVDTAVRKEEIITELNQEGISVIVGETALTGVLQKAINDFLEKGELEQVYEAPRAYDLSGFPFNAEVYEFLDRRTPSPMVLSLLGCPTTPACAFCSKELVTGKGVRKRPAEEVAEEITQRLRRSGKKGLRFADAMMFPNPETHRLMEMLIRLQEVKALNLSEGFTSCTSSDVLNSPSASEFLGLLKRAGCVQILWGIESPFPSKLEKLGKTPSLGKSGETIQEVESRVREKVKLIHEAGMAVTGLFIFDPDYSEKEALQLVEFVDETGIDTVALSILTPLPGTKLYEEMKGRGITQDLTRFDLFHTTYPPTTRTEKEARQLYRQVLIQINSPRRLLGRTISFIEHSDSFRTAIKEFQSQAVKGLTTER